MNGRHHETDTERIRLPLHDMPTDPGMRIPLNTAPRPGPQHQAPARVEPSYQDVVIPRVFVEPDEQMDGLRQQSLRWAIWRDRLAVVVLLMLIGWFTRPVWILPVEWMQR